MSSIPPRKWPLSSDLNSHQALNPSLLLLKSAIPSWDLSYATGRQQLLEHPYVSLPVYFIDIYEDKHLPLISFISLFLLGSLWSDPGAFRLHSTAYIQLCCGSEHGTDTSIDTRVIQSYHRDMMQCSASIITLISQWPAILLAPPPREAHTAYVLLQIS